MQSKLLPKPEKTSTGSLLGTGEFVATRDQLMEWIREDSDRRLDNLARYILAKPSKLARRRFLEVFEGRHGQDVTDALKAKILALVQK
jgi:hypothetical protein